MNAKSISKNILLTAAASLLGSVLLAVGGPLCEVNRFLYGGILMLGGVGLYVLYAIVATDRNWLDIRAVFSGVWLFTIGLAALRLTDYQEPWQNTTWILLASAYLVFLLGSTLGLRSSKTIYDKLKSKLSAGKLGRFHLKLSGNRLFWICLITTLIGLVCFLCNVAVRGYVPAFAELDNAYLSFYTKFHVFAVAATGVVGLCYYTLVTQKLSTAKRVILIVCIAYLLLIFPILVVSRGVLVVAGLSLTTAVFYLHKKKFILLLLCLGVIFGVYCGLSQLRGYSEEQLDSFFEPSDITIVPSDNNNTELTFTLPPSAAFLYTYLTVSHDNFNEAVENATDFAYGAKQLVPFNVILKSQWITDQNNRIPFYQVRKHLNTGNVISYFYYDFGAWGVILLTLLWAFVFGLMQGFYTHGKGPFALMVLGNTMSPVALSFFTVWLSSFSHWMLWGVALLAALAACIRFPRKTAVTGDPQ